MSSEAMEVAAALAAALEAENAALRAMDIPRAVAGFPHKSEWCRRLQLSLADDAARGPDRRLDTATARRLQDLAEENRRLLERAMFVQGRLIATLARAARPPRLGYGRQGASNAATPPMALSARA